MCLDQKLAATDDGWAARQQQIYLASGLSYRGDVNRLGLQMFDRCRGGRTVAEALAGLEGINAGEALTVIRRSNTMV